MKNLSKKYAQQIFDFLVDCDFSGFNIKRFDLPMLETEFSRADIVFSRIGHRILDSQLIYHKLEPRDLSAAYEKYCGKKLENAHSSEADTRASIEILKAQLENKENMLK